ncbi:Mycobacterium numidiamassiliense ORFan, partial [Mycobacterium numidiamassiliense]
VHGIDEVACDPGRITGLDVGQLTKQLSEDGAQLGPGHVCTQTKVHSSAAEAQVRVGTATQVETVRVVERYLKTAN